MTKTDIWHHRLGHPSPVKLHLLHNKFQILVSLPHLSSHCKICHMAKQKRLTFVSNNNLSPKSFDLIHIDIWGPFHVSTPARHKYFLTNVGDCTLVTWVYLLRTKADVHAIFSNFNNFVFNQYNTTIKSVRSDNAPELPFIDFFRSKGIFSYYSSIDTPEKNSIVERKHQHILCSVPHVEAL